MVPLPAVALVATTLSASAVSCPASHAEVRVQSRIVPPQKDFTKSTEQLRMIGAQDAIGSRQFVELGAVTIGTITFDSEIRTVSGGAEGGPLCVRPSIVTITVSTAPTVYVDAARGQCQVAATMGHEMRHVSIDTTVIDRYVPIFRARVARMIDAIGASAAPSADDVPAVRERIEDKINAMIAVTVETLKVDRKAAQTAIDTQDEYRRIANSCPIVSTRSG